MAASPSAASAAANREDDMLDRVGAEPISEQRCSFRVWAPHARTVAVKLVDDRRLEVLKASGQGYHTGTLEHVRAGTRYLYSLSSDLERPDPASRWQADGVHGPSRVTDLRYEWTDGAWRGLPLASYVLYELHVGTYSRAGTFAGAQQDANVISDQTG
ncbi:MAG TPA: hypothetical protein VG963_08340 [Polyangiaceae bacterium]|nr:hypothetical protein [Polyangiaceae bacterium]